jgi:hypothetical protein
VSQSKPRLGPAARRLLQLIADHPLGITTEALKSAKIYMEPWPMVRSLDGLASQELVKLSNDGKRWLITTHGTRRLGAMPCEDIEPYVGVVVPPRQIRFAGVYMGEELRPQQARPAGNVAATIPSLISGVRVMRTAG